MNSQKSPLRQIILDFPQQFKKGLAAAKNIRVNGKFDKLVICGMGGSALPADILKTYLESKKIKLPIFISRDYYLPFQADSKSLIFISSYSGDTEETLTCYKEARAKGFKIVGLAKGGKLAKLCPRDKEAFVKYPPEIASFQPRFALGYVFGAMVQVLINCRLIPDFTVEINDFIANFQPANFEELGKKLAQKSKNLIPIFYASTRYGKSVARICKIIINETSKTQAFWNVLPEMNHNEMVGFTKLIGGFHIIIWEDRLEHPRILKRMKALAVLLRKKGLLVSEAAMEGKTVLEKIFNTLMVGSWLSYYLALAYHQDPLPVEMVEEFKKKI